MLDTSTKRRIDTARDILVGKVPDPKSQVEQITIALIYKFMDDMDAEAEELGGKRSFFAGEFAKYGWAKLMRSGLGGHEALGLYSEAITRMPENPGVPPLFRDIFKNAYLPYRDPETLRAFLKVIDEFEYDHSERLGDAFEYLLSVLGSQGDAGQFRTPRHIIDFIVDIVDPKKGETILDPACGTAGFLISAWKHIQAANRDANGESTLTPDDQERLASNIKGYDISPDMVRLSLANMYLHGFTDPHIVEYDTLTSDERWNEFADVILANPPFMSPKGGIRPHNRFSIQSNRSEVLFVDYMAEHLTANGRAGIIVPEGVIFQSGKAYKALRKELVEKYLVAVVSLPAGVFNPYSGVKTSILILDRATAKASDTIGFFKVTNDGFGLGAQRREIGGSELPEVVAEIGAYRAHAGDEEWEGRFGRAVEKAEIAASGDYNLSGERYRAEPEAYGAWPLVSLASVTKRLSGGTPSKANSTYWNGSIPWVSPKDMKDSLLHTTEDYVTSEAVDSSATKLVPPGTVLCVVRSGILKHSLPLAIAGREMCFNQDIVAFLPDAELLESRFLFQTLKYLTPAILKEGIKTGVTVQSFHNGFLDRLEIPVPPLEVQREIVTEIEGYQKVIDGARTVVENYRPHIAANPEWPIVPVGDVASVQRGASPRPIHDFLTDSTDGVNWVKIGDAQLGGKYITQTADKITKEGARRSRPVFVGDFVLSNSMSFGRPYIMAIDGYIHDGWLLLREDPNKIDKEYFYYALGSDNVIEQFKRSATGGVVNNLNSTLVSAVRIPLPPLNEQQDIVAELEAERVLVEANRELIQRMERKVEAAIARVWGAAVEPEIAEPALAAE